MHDTWIPMPRYKLRKDLVRRILELENPKGKTCLELGYGAGDMLLMYADLGLEVHGYDFSEAAYRNASNRLQVYPTLKKQINLYRDIHDLPGQSYDYLMAFEVLEHIEDDVSCLREWRNMLGKNGKLLISVPAHESKWGASDIAAGHYRRYEREMLTKLLLQSGFKIILFWNYAFPISILLDFFLHHTYNFKPTDKQTKEDLSRLSGIKRKNNLTNRIAASDLFLMPFIHMQKFFLDKDLSSAYLVFAEKTI